MLLSFLIIASGWWHIRAAYGSDSRQFYISKPLTMLFIIALAFGYQSDDHDGSHAWILLGLCLSLAGDVLLMLPRDCFIQGLAAFFVAHLCYIVGFAQGPLVLNLVDGLLLLLVAGMVFGLLWGRLGEMKSRLLLHAGDHRHGLGGRWCLARLLDRGQCRRPGGGTDVPLFRQHAGAGQIPASLSSCHGLDHEQLLRGTVSDRSLPGGVKRRRSL